MRQVTDSLVERISGLPTRIPYEHKARTLGELYILSASHVYSGIKKINKASREGMNYEKEHKTIQNVLEG